MPELPEVETTRRDLCRTVLGRTFVEVALEKPKLFRGLHGLTLSNLVGRRVQDLRRRGKLLIWNLSDDLTLIMHLKLAGQLIHQDANGSELMHGGHPGPMWGTPMPHRATHFTARFDDGSVLYMTDIRQFARLVLMPTDELAEFLAELDFGPEPLEPEFAWRPFYAKLQRRSVPIKTVLLDQSVLAGVGNIYADESLWTARLNPLRPASSLSVTEVKRLRAGIRSVLDYAIREGVAFVPQGKALSDRDFPYAHGRKGQPCARCGRTILREWVNGRATYWCPKCQPARPRAGRSSARAA